MARREHRQADDVWLNLLLFPIGEHAEMRRELVTGAVVSVRKAGDRLALWISDADNLETVVKVELRMFLTQLMQNIRLVGQPRRGWVCDAKTGFDSVSTGKRVTDGELVVYILKAHLNPEVLKPLWLCPIECAK